MREINTIKEIQNITYNILVAFDFFCRSHNLKYVLAAGTLLGSVRHNGFIPWDDDIDVMMPRPDYEKFIELTIDGLSEFYKTVTSANIDADIPYIAYTKIIDTRTILIENIGIKNKIGVFIDVFPLDGLPQTPKRIKKHYLLLHFIKKIIELQKIRTDISKNKFKSYLKKIIIPIIKLIPAIHIQEKIAKYYKYNNSELISCQVCDCDIKNIYKKEDIENTIELPFNNHLFFVPANYNCILKKQYGDYMTPPPIEQQITHHSNKAYWKDGY